MYAHTSVKTSAFESTVMQIVDVKIKSQFLLAETVVGESVVVIKKLLQMQVLCLHIQFLSMYSWQFAGTLFLPSATRIS